MRKEILAEEYEIHRAKQEKKWAQEYEAHQKLLKSAKRKLTAAEYNAVLSEGHYTEYL